MVPERHGHLGRMLGGDDGRTLYLVARSLFRGDQWLRRPIASIPGSQTSGRAGPAPLAAPDKEIENSQSPGLRRERRSMHERPDHARDTGLIRLLHLSDLHLVEDFRARTYGELCDRNLNEVLDECSAIGPPEILVATGDIADDSSPAAYARAAKRLRAVTPQAYWVPGNHDSAALMSELAPIGFPHVAPFGPWEIVLLDSAWPGHDAGRIGNEQLAWLESHLRRSSHHVIVALHHPPIPACSDQDCGISDASHLLDLIGRSPQIRLVLSGHNHRPFEHRQGKAVFLGAPSTCRQIHHQSAHHVWTNEGPAARMVSICPYGTLRHELIGRRPPFAHGTDNEIDEEQ